MFKMSPVIRGRFLFVTICPFVTSLFVISFVITPAKCCSCMQQDLKSDFCASEYSAIVTIKSPGPLVNSMARWPVLNGPSRFPVTHLPAILPLSTQNPNSSSLGPIRVPIESDPIRLFSVHKKRIPRDTKTWKHYFHSTDGNVQKYQLIPAQPLPNYPFDDQLALPSGQKSADPYPRSNAAKKAELEIIARSGKKKFTPLNFSAVQPWEQIINFNLDHFITGPSMAAREALLNGLAFINRRSSCAPNLQVNKKYVIWGRMANGNILRLHLCNTLSYATLDEDRRQTVMSFLQGEADCKRR